MGNVGYRARPELRERLAADGSETLGSTPEQAARHIASESSTYGKLIKAIGLKAE